MQAFTVSAGLLAGVIVVSTAGFIFGVVFIIIVVVLVGLRSHSKRLCLIPLYKEPRR